MKRMFSSLALAVALVMVVASPALGGKFHFKSADFTTGSLTFNGVGVGLGNSNYLATMDATATVRALCVNKGGTVAPGRNDILVELAGPQDQLIKTDDNGQTQVSLTVGDPIVADLDAPPNTKKDCPNGKWTVEGLIVMEWTSAHVVINELGTGATLYDQAFACSGGGVTLDADGNPISDGMGGYLLNPVACVEA